MAQGRILFRVLEGSIQIVPFDHRAPLSPQTSFGLRVYPTGRKAWVLSYRAGVALKLTAHLARARGNGRMLSGISTSVR